MADALQDREILLVVDNLDQQAVALEAREILKEDLIRIWEDVVDQAGLEVTTGVTVSGLGSSQAARGSGLMRPRSSKPRRKGAWNGDTRDFWRSARNPVGVAVTR